MAWTIIKFLYTAIKVIVLVGLVVGIAISRQCNDQMVEICQLVGGCNW